MTQRRSHEIDYEVFGDDLPLVEVELDPGEVVIAEAGSMMYMEDGISFEARLGDGADARGMWSSLKSVAKRAVVRESVFLTHFTNTARSGKRRIALAAPYPGTIMPVDLLQVGGQIIAQREAFLCAAAGTEINIAFNRRIASGLFGGEGFIMQSISGDGLAFLHAGGTVMEKHLNGDTLRVETGCVVGFQPSVSYSIARAGNLRSMAFGGEGMFLTTLSGSGFVWLQSMPRQKVVAQVLASHLHDHAPRRSELERARREQTRKR